METKFANTVVKNSQSLISREIDGVVMCRYALNATRRKDARNMRKGWFVAQEDTDLYNVFNRADFDEEGYLHGYNGQGGYHEDDFDIVFESNRFDDCVRWIDNKINE